MSTVPGAQSQHGSSGRGCSCSPAEAAASAPRLGSARALGRGSGMGCGSLASKGQGKGSVWGCPVHQGGGRATSPVLVVGRSTGRAGWDL